MPIPFEDFMKQALHDPEQGYYARHIPSVGGRGDFTTAPMLSDQLARAIALWAAKAMRENRCRNLIEIGPGTGQLSRQVWKALPWRLRITSRLHLVETSEKLTRLQQQTLSSHPQWHRCPIKALEACGGNAVIFSNELVDAFPVKRFQMTTDGWREMAVERDPAGRASESLMQAAELPKSSIFQRQFPVGQCVEVHDSYREWLQAWLPHWHRGRMLTIDYGAACDSLYQRQPHGSIRAYLLHQRLTGPSIYENIGRQDLTADVNFTDLIDWARDHCTDHRLQPLSDFLHPSDSQTRLADPDGAGQAFQVLDQARPTTGL